MSHRLRFTSLRDLTRTRKPLVREITRHTQRIQKTIEEVNITLTAVISDILEQPHATQRGHLLARCGQIGSSQCPEHAPLVFGGRRQRLFRLTRLACPPGALHHAPNPEVAPLEEVMTGHGMNATSGHEG